MDHDHPRHFPYPVFPPPNVQLHPDDANNKVFLAVARAFVAVGNRAMTIKDIAEQASRYGLVCQNLSAAAQAVTTYLRAHKARCDQQDDLPLLLSHTLSGTPADDDLVPALFSRSGGDSHPLPDRLTNFRKGTSVWYLSRATGVPCPFAKSGIRLCDYAHIDPADPEKEAGRERKRLEREQICGQKRKRPLRGCVAKANPSSDNERPPKVKLTLRLKPLGLVRQQNAAAAASQSIASSSTTTPKVAHDSSDLYDSADDDSISVDSSDDEPQTSQINKEPEEEPWSLPPYPRRSISIPCYTPSPETYYSYYPPEPSLYKDPFRRSPSVPFSSDATPPPESDEEFEDFRAMTRSMKRRSLPMPRHDDELGWDADLDSEGEEETMWESPAPHSPVAHQYIVSDVSIKQEPRDVQGMLDAWDDLDTVGGHPIDPTSHHSWVEPIPGIGTVTDIKQEDYGVATFFADLPDPTSPLSPISSVSPAFSSCDTPSSSPDDIEEDSVNDYTIRSRPKAVSTPNPFFPPTNAQQSLLANSSSNVREPAASSSSLSVTTASGATSGSALSPSPCVSPHQVRAVPTPNNPSSSIVLVSCMDSVPNIDAIHIEGIPVYHMILGAFTLLRRIDTDFVNLSPIMAMVPILRSGSSANTPNLSEPVVISNTVRIDSGSSAICGRWVPLCAAQKYVWEHLPRDPKYTRALELFLSPKLLQSYSAIDQTYTPANQRDPRLADRFGPHFGSTRDVLGLGKDTTAKVGEDFEVPVLGRRSAVPASRLQVFGGLIQRAEDSEVPLSATEQELFHELCVIPGDWEGSGPSSSGCVADDERMVVDGPATVPATPTTARPAEMATKSRHRSTCSVSSMSSLSSSGESDNGGPTRGKKGATESSRPLRRSKRVADAIAAAVQPVRGRPRKRG